MKLIPTAVSRAVGKQIFQAKKNSPTILFVGGVAGVVTTTVLACRATLRLEEVLDETQGKLSDVNSLQHSKYSEEDRQRDKVVIYTQAVIEITKLYGPALLVGAASIAALTGSHNILNKRNAALGAAYAALDKGFEEYRRRVVDEFGEEKDRELRYGYEMVELVEETPKGHKVKTVKRVGPNAGGSIYAKMFDETNLNWQPTPSFNQIFLKAQQEYANHKLRASGWLTLNEVYESIGFEKTQAGMVVGWVYGGDGDDYVDFGLGEWPTADDFVNGREGAVLLDFNVDGNIYDKL